MSSFVPLNVYPDSDSDGEADNTREIQVRSRPDPQFIDLADSFLQIEEALKLYQRALKLHTDGEWEEAHMAYDELFGSELFLGDAEDEEVYGGNSGSGSSLPLVLYLSYKNHGAFKLDRLKATGTKEDIQDTIEQALEWFATALGRDAGDASLWRKAAQLALAIDSSRLARFALESVLDHETVGADSAHDALALVMGGIPNPEEYLASMRLRGVLRQICDTTSLESDRFRALPKKMLHPRFDKFTNPYPWLPLPDPQDSKALQGIMDQITENRQTIMIASRTWPSVGAAILSQISDDGSTELPPNSSSSLQIIIPQLDGEEASRETTPDQPTPASGSKSGTATAEENEDTTMTDASALEPVPPPATGRRRSGSATRKRKSASLGAEGGDAGRSRLSKRQRDKKEADAAAAAAAAAAPESKQKIRQETQDEKLFSTAEECFSPLGVSLGTASALKFKAGAESASGDPAGIKEDLYLDDFRKILQYWDDDKGNVILYGEGVQSPDEATHGMAFLDLEANVQSRPALIGDEGLKKWVSVANARGPSPQEAGFEYLKALCMRDMGSTGNAKKTRGALGTAGASSWVRHSWPESLKETVTAIANECEEICWTFFKRFEENLVSRINEFRESDYAIIEWAQTTFEIFLEDLAAGERQKSGVELPVGGEEALEVRREKVKRWSYLVRDLMYCRPRSQDGQLPEDQLTLRYLWATAVLTAFTGASRDFRLECFGDLKGLLSENKLQSIELPNSSVMPEISAQRAEREISKLKTVDFFTSIFQATTDIGGERDPLEVIDILEAVLEPGAVSPYDEQERKMLQEISRFLEGSSAMFRLHLWERLKAAYEKVGYRPKVLSCVLRSMGVLIGDLKSKSYLESAEDHRHFVLLRSLRLVEEMLPLSLSLISGGAGSVNVLVEVDKEGLIDAMKALAALLRLLHCYAFWEDAVANHEVSATIPHSYRVLVAKFREMIVRAWAMMYLIYREAIERGMGCEINARWERGEREEKLAGLLRDVHEELGSRHYCKLSNHLLLKLVHDELLRFDLREFDHDLLQCIHCRFHLAICSDQVDFYDHKTDPENLDKVTVMQLMDFVLFLASRKKVLQLQKSDIKAALEKLFDVVGVPKRSSNNKLAHNEAVIDQYLRGSIRPLQLLNSLKGEGCLSTVEAGGLYAQVAAKGLYFTLGKISLYPIRYQKRVGAVRGDDLDNAIRFFRYDLTCNPNKWETWYRLGQSYESQMDDGQAWGADLINARRADLVRLERKTILCYMRALCLAIQDGYPDSAEARGALSSLYADFGTRIYSATRPPMEMESFSTEGYERHYSGTHGEGMYKSPAHRSLGLSNGLKFASVLFQSSLNDSPDNWKAHYMIGKCMGKLFKGSRMFTPEAVLAKYVQAVEHCPDKSGNDHIFEPHHKLVSSACKYVLQGLMEPKRACEILKATHFTKRMEHVETRDQFVRYILEVLKRMRSADKPKWHHRMTNRAAQLKLYELHDIAGARAEIASLFSNKQVTLTIWKPENERTGRHFVYASKYTTFHASLLEQLDDRATLEAVAKKVRKGATGLFRHTDVWTQVFMAYIKVLRRTGSVPDQGDEDVFKNVSYDEFNTYSQRLDIYCNLGNASSPTLDLLRETFELRRLNAGLAKTPFIDDLLADTYSKLYSELVPEILKQLTEAESTRANPMSLKNLMSNEEQPQSEASAVALAAAHSKLDDLPIRGKMTKVTKRELVSKACSLCKSSAVPQPKSAPTTHPSSPKVRSAQPQGGSPEDTPMGSPNDGAKDSEDDITSDLELSATRMDEE